MTDPRHELPMCDLLAPERRPRYRELLAKGPGKSRQKFIETLNHTLRVDPRFAARVVATRGGGEETEQAWILAELRRHGAPATCYVMSTDHELDMRTLPLEEALNDVYGCLRGALISCIPGELAYYEAEDLGERYILRRPRRS